MLLVSHSMEDIARYADKVLVMAQKKVAMYDTVEKVFARAEELLADGLMAGGMVPKLKNCIAAVRGGVRRVLILDGRVEHTLLLESVSDQIMGTAIIPDEPMPDAPAFR